ncbi:receptor-type tyrosine-protein phosphatase kappa-like [Tubulanus polymorphus]|uniref:receptor-type tyrosine-protein phosphatase kappa-like n=1 Tax=Tubulanus polymorphus TaxID=672921 RepID=UPI003DA6C6BC
MLDCRCDGNAICDYLSGTCSTGCLPNYIGHSCEQEFKWTSPSTPTTTSTENSITINWPAYSGSVVDSGRGNITVYYDVWYIVESKKGDGIPPWFHVGVTSQTQAQLTGLTQNTNYTVAVYLHKYQGDSMVSKSSLLVKLVSNAKTTCGEPAKGPTGLKLESTQLQGDSRPLSQYTKAKAEVSWHGLTADEFRCKADSAWYQVEYKKKDEEIWMKLNAGTGIPSATITGLTPYTRYIIRVGVRNKSGATYKYSDEIEITTATGVPGPVRDLETTVKSDTSLTVNWSPPTTLNGEISKYKVWYRQLKYKACSKTVADQFHQKPETSLLTKTITGLIPFSEYEITVQPFTSASTGSEKNKECITASTEPAAPVGTPAKATVSTEHMTTRATVRFPRFTCKNMNGKFTGFNYEVRKTSDHTIVDSKTAHQYWSAITGLTPYTDYYLKYKWGNSIGETEFSQKTIFKTDESVPQVAKPIAQSASTDSLIFAWQPKQPPFAKITGYHVRCGNATGNRTASGEQHRIFYRQSFRPPHYQVILKNLRASSWYWCRVAANGKKGWSGYSRMVYFYTIEGKPGPPDAVNASDITESGAELTWKPPKSPNGKISGYKLACKPVQTLQGKALAQAVGTPIEFEVKETRKELTKLESFTQYACNVTAKTGKGYGNSAQWKFWTSGQLDISPPEVVRVTNSTIDIKLTPVTKGNVSAYHFVVEKQDVPIGGRKKRAVAIRGERRYENYEEARRRGLKAYLAAVVVELSLTAFTIGDGKNYSGFYNAPLQKETPYVVILGVETTVDGQNVDVTYTRMQGEPIYPRDDQSSVVLLVVVAAAVLLVVLCAVAVFLLVRNKRRVVCLTKRSNETTGESAPMQNIQGRQPAATSGGQPVITVPDPAIARAGGAPAVAIASASAAAAKATTSGAEAEDDLYETVELSGVSVQDLLKHTQHKLDDNMKILKNEFESVPKLKEGASEVASNKENMKKNRYHNIVTSAPVAAVTRATGAPAVAIASTSVAAATATAAAARATTSGAEAEDDLYETVVWSGVSVHDLLKHTLHKLDDNMKILKNEFESVPKLKEGASEVASNKENMMKNRYRNIVPYDASRVVLEVEPGADPYSDYVNANYIQGFVQGEGHIACQAPLESTIEDHWRMVWQLKCPCIVILTELTEANKGGKVKCTPYWPTEAPRTYGNLTVSIRKETKIYSDPVVYCHYLTISKPKCDSHDLVIFQYKGWPDHGVPFPASEVVILQQFIKERMAGIPGPVVVHCSSGCGWTGSYLAAEYLMNEIARCGKASIFSIYKQMRDSRPEMIQNLKQYLLVHQILLEELVLGVSRHPVAGFEQSYRRLLDSTDIVSSRSLAIYDKIEEQFLVYKASTVVQSNESVAYAKSANIATKSRHPDIIPEKQHLVPLPSMDKFAADPVKNPTFVNATFIHTSTRDNMFIATQTPLPSTVNEFWCTVFDHGCEILVMMHQEDQNDRTYCDYWPSDAPTTYGLFTVTPRGGAIVVPNSTVVSREFEVEKKGGAARYVCQFQFTEWDANQLLPSKETLFSLVDIVTNERKTSPILVHCMDGATRTGLFCGAYDLLSRAASDDTIDIYNELQYMRRTRAQFIPNCAQFRILHEILVLYFRDFDMYANFR